MSLSINGDGTLSGVTAIGDVSSTELDYVDGVTAPIQTQLNDVGLVYLDTKTFSATSPQYDNVFTTDFNQYVLVSEDITGSTAAAVLLQLCAGGTPSATTIYRYTGRGGYIGVDGLAESNAAASMLIGFASNAPGQFQTIISRPAVAVRTNFMSQGVAFTTGDINAVYWRNTFGFHDAATAYDGFKLSATTGTLTGSVHIFGRIRNV